jgi:phage tail-like protein
MSDANDPLPAFYFTLHVLGKPGIHARHPDADASFQEISGIEAERDVEPVVEGGENRFVHQLPKAVHYSNLVLKRGVTSADSFLSEWIGKSLASNLTSRVEKHDLMVALLNEQGAPAVAWTFTNAFPVKYELSALNSQENKILIETLEFSYNTFKRDER